MNNISALTIYAQDLYEINKSCRDPARLLGGRPRSSTNVLYVGSSFGDCFFLIYEFPNEEERLKWENSLPEFAKEWITDSGEYIIKEYGWGAPGTGPEWEGQLDDENFSLLVVSGGAREAQEVFQTYKPKKYKRIDLFPLSNRPETWILFQFQWAEEREVWEAGLPPVMKSWLNSDKVKSAKTFRK